MTGSSIVNVSLSVRLPRDPDSDGDGVPDFLDEFPLDPNPAFGSDKGKDDITDGTDTCAIFPNPNRLDTDGDFVGDVCGDCSGIDNTVWGCPPSIIRTVSVRGLLIPAILSFRGVNIHLGRRKGAPTT